MTAITPLRTIDFAGWMQVNDTLQGYADALDRADMEALLSHFDADACWHYSPTVERRGHAEIRAFFDERFSVFARTSHHVCAPVLSAGAGPGLIDSTAYFSSEHLLVDGSRYSAWGRYVDRLRLTDSRAVICDRTVMVHALKGIDRPANYLPRKVPAAT